MTNAEKRTMISKLYIGQTKKITLKKKTFKINQEKAIRRNLGQSSNENVPCKVENYGECVNH